MIVQIQNVGTFLVCWDHVMARPNPKGKGYIVCETKDDERHPKAKRATSCSIHEAVADKDGYFHKDDQGAIVSSLAVCSDEDAFIKDVGRKTSLTGALRSLTIRYQGIDKSARSTFWDKYFEMRKGKKASPKVIKRSKVQQVVLVPVLS